MPNNLTSAEAIQEYITASTDNELQNIWNNLQESFEEMADRIQCFNTILKKRLRA